MVLLLVAAAIPRLLLAFFEHGTNHPDEIFQMLEPAHRVAFGFGLESWEFQFGARSWLLPGVVGLIWKGLAAVGITNPLIAIPLLRLPFVALALLSIFLCARLATRLAGPKAGLFAGALLAFLPAALLMDFRTTTEAASAPLVLGALLWIMNAHPARAGALLGALPFLRPTNGLLGLAVVGSLLLEKRFREVGRLLLGAAPVMLAGGLLDYATWGRPFHHLIEYFRFNLMEGGAKGFGTEPFWFYLWALLATAPLIALGLPALLPLARRVPLARASLFTVLASLLVHSGIGHKEIRFLLPIIPLLVALVASGLWLFVSTHFDLTKVGPQVRRSLVVAGAVALVILGIVRVRSLTFEELSDTTGEPKDTLIQGNRDRLNRLMVRAGRDPSMCGLVIIGVVPHELFSGGLSYLGRDVFLSSPTSIKEWPLFSQAANFAVMPAAVQPPGWNVVATSDDVVLRQRAGTCVPLPPDQRPRFIRAGNRRVRP
jgi:hypothetical protein